MSPTRMFSVKLFDPTIIVPGGLLEEPPEDDGENPQPLIVAARVAIITHVNASFFVIFLFLLSP